MSNIVVPQDTKFVDADGKLTRPWVHFLSDMARVLNDLRARVEALENQ